MCSLHSKALFLPRCTCKESKMAIWALSIQNLLLNYSSSTPNDISSLTPRTYLRFNPCDYNWETDATPNPRSRLVYNHERQTEAHLTRRFGSNHPKYYPNKFEITLYDLNHSLLEHMVPEAMGKSYFSESEVEIPPYDEM